jgi:uncharacterized protein (DUF2235 family)
LNCSPEHRSPYSFEKEGARGTPKKLEISMAKNLALFFDGTWNQPGSDEEDGGDTNVVRMFNAVQFQHNGRPQVAEYFAGVGTRWYERVRGGAFGFGLDRGIREGYRWLLGHYEPGDDVYLFGFSRGAYTARSLVGLIRNAGLLVKIERETPAGRIPLPIETVAPEGTDRELDAMIERAYELYRSRDNAAHPKGVMAQQFRAAFSREIPIKCLGVWDTVGALGIPLRAFQWLNDDHHGFHDTKLSRIVENAFHAVALDEHREAFKPALWGSIDAGAGQTIQQTWFPGDHGDVGGGHEDDRKLAEITLRWMQERAESAGLGTKQPSRTPLGVLLEEAQRHNTYAGFLGGVYARKYAPYYRSVGRAEDGPQDLHEAVFAYRKAHPAYAPPNAGFAELLAATEASELAVAEETVPA